MNDYISRELAITMCPHIAIDTLKKIPAANVVEQKTGKWTEDSISSPIDKWVIYGFNCSECNQISSFNSNYCSNCGARMILE